ncbi:1-phosphatidylinositol 3-phosphate 5-kinase [Sitophilus oryzae]|uniref:1-phosphatidylinositol-3-phosphate 5-kinase n=1 Tax=Sitophilus oryzae TaxID=7048 RepID=A0A6J2YHB6_SITOR|nr:1-phosphatidylinositol 3-phosphate 5-kinase [Sitophilus oryzae]
MAPALVAAVHIHVVDSTCYSHEDLTPTKLTEFAPLQQEEKPQTVGQFISKFFKITKSEETSAPENNCAIQETVPTWAKETSDSSESPVPNIYPVDVNEGRSLQNVLKRISNLVALRTNNLQDYADTDLKQYWMPDSVSKECYECSEKFTTFRRKHHCRVCGQIFCSQCCNQNQQIPGKIFGCTGDLRVCTYCCKVVLSYLQSSNFGVNLTADLKALQESLQNKFGVSPSGSFSYDTSQKSNLNTSESSEQLRRKISVGYQEEKFASGSSVSYLTNEEKCKALQNSVSLRNLFDEICKPVTGVSFSPYKFRLRTFQDCFLGSELVDWLIFQQKAKTRIQAAALCQALLEGGYIESFSEPSIFTDGYVRYKKGNLFSPSPVQISPNFEVPIQDEPSWVQQISHESSNTDSENEQISPSLPGLSSSSSYMLNLNVEASTVYLSRPTDLSYDIQNQDVENVQQCEHEETTVIRPSEQRELAPESGWFNVPTLREENGEKEAYELLSETYEQHEQTLLKQLLSSRSLPHSWESVLLPLIQDIVSVVRPDKNHDAIELDIRNYVQIKKLPGGNKNDTCLVNGIVCSKNVAHKEMCTDIENPKILLLECSIVYQRTEGRLMSLEPVMMQEHEYLRHVACRIVSLRPDVVLVHKNVSRLAQDMLRKNNITLVYNVKHTILERLSRCTQADVITSVDAHIGRPKLGTCKRFYLKKYNVGNGTQKTLMFFEGLPCPWLGATVLLRCPSKIELSKVKKIASFLLFACYNWRLEKSFLMDEFALPPNSKIEFLDDSLESSPQFPKPKMSIEDQIDEDTQKSETKKEQIPEKKTKPSENNTQKITGESVSDFTDPLQSSFDLNKTDFVVDSNETLSVAELPFSNNFKKHLDDTILCISPYVMFPIPYLETDSGKKTKLRRFFYKDLYYSEQFEGNVKNKRKTFEAEKNLETENNHKNVSPLHPFQTVQITNVNCNDIQNLLAHFRASGGQYRKKEILDVIETNDEKSLSKDNCETKKDVLDPVNHQRLAVLFCSFSHESSNAPAFCVNPWVVYMDFYGRNDIPIGCFLERYCFRATYACPSKTCVTPMVKHIRRFVHNLGCVTISLNNFENEFTEEGIVMWSWCTKCQSVSPVVPMSSDTWSYSFAKYLELRFHGEIFSRRGQNSCKHSLHHDHFQYFGYKNYVASFKYSSINIWEISLPSSLVQLTYDTANLHQVLIDDTKKYAQKGHEILNLIQDKVSSITTEDLEGVGNIKQLLSKEQAQFKQKVEEVQLKLTSPTVENKDFDTKVLCQSYWKIQDNVTRLKIYLMEVTETWNSYLTEALRQDKKKEKHAVSEIDSPVGELTESKTFGNTSNEHEKDSTLENCDPRRLSDASIATHIEESTDSKKDLSKKSEKTVKTIFDKFLPSSGTFNLVQAPFSPQEHYLLPIGQYGPVIVYENEVSSIIAYALNSIDYKKSLEELTSKKSIANEQTPSPIAKRKNVAGDKEKNDGGEKGSGLLGFLRTKDSKTDLGSSVSSSVSEIVEPEQSNTQDKPDDAKKSKQSHVEVQFQDSTCNFFCRIYLAEKFAALRSVVFPTGEETYIRSLSRSVHWKARGGKSGSNFSKTMDDRFILKDMSKTEIQLFLESASNYFVYMQKCSTTAQPTLLGKILGIYQIIYKNNSNVTYRSHVLVMENLFYNREVSQKFDLKGSMRNRLVVPETQEGEIVLLDENLLKMTCDSPLYVLPHSKEVLLAAIQNDTEFLSTQSVMDYSLLVGLDTKNKELVLGIIDYIRTFTWDKRLETIVKRTGILGGQGKLPTIVSPEEYQKRFIEAMHKYFLEVPDHYAGLCKGLEV